MSDVTSRPSFQLTAGPARPRFERIEDVITSHRSAVSSIRQAFGVGKSGDRASCPICGGKHLSVFTTPKGFRLKCFSRECDPTEIRALWREHLGIATRPRDNPYRPSHRLHQGQETSHPAQAIGSTKPQGNPASFIASALAALPDTTDTTAQEALRSYLVGRGLPAQHLGFIGAIDVRLGTSKADKVKVRGWHWGQLTQGGDALIFPCYRRESESIKAVYLQSILVRPDASGIYRKRLNNNGTDKQYLSTKKTPCNKTGVFVPLCSKDALSTAKIAYVVEGVATGCAVAVMLEMAGLEGVVICALDAGNLADVGASLPMDDVRFFADVDATLKGQRSAIDAAKAAQKAGKRARVILHDSPLSTEEIEAWLRWMHAAHKPDKKPTKRGIDALDLFALGTLTNPDTLGLLDAPRSKMRRLGGVDIAAKGGHVKQLRAMLSLSKKLEETGAKERKSSGSFASLLKEAERHRVKREDLGKIPDLPKALLLFLDATLGSGKSYRMLQEIERATGALLPTYRRALVDNLIDRCTALFDYRHIGNLRGGDGERIEATKKIALCIDSLASTIKDTGSFARPLVAIDEAFATLQSAIAPKHGASLSDRLYSRILYLRDSLKKASRIILSEAALDAQTPAIIEALTGIPTSQPCRVSYDKERGAWVDEEGRTPEARSIVWASHVSKHPYRWRFAKTKEALISHLVSAAQRGEKLACFAVSKGDVLHLAALLRRRIEGIKVMEIHGDQGIEDRQAAISSDQWKDADVVLYNTAAESGISIDIEGFTATYVLGSALRGVSWRSMYQGAARVRKTSTMEIRAWVDNAEEKGRSEGDILHDLLKSEQDFCGLLRPLLAEMGTAPAFAYEANDKEAVAFYTKTLAAHEAACSLRLEKLLARLAFEDADIGELVEQPTEEIDKATLRESKRDLKKEIAAQIVETSKAITPLALKTLIARVEDPNLATTAEEAKTIEIAQRKALKHLASLPDTTAEEAAAVKGEDGASALALALQRIEAPNAPAKLMEAMEASAARASRLAATRAEDPANATRQELEIAKAHRLMRGLNKKQLTKEEAEKGSERIKAARLLVDAVTYRHRPDLLLLSALPSHARRRSLLDERGNAVEVAKVSALLSSLVEEACPEVAALLDVASSLFGGNEERKTRSFDPSLFFNVSDEQDLFDSYQETFSWLSQLTEGKEEEGEQEDLLGGEMAHTEKLNSLKERVCAKQKFTMLENGMTPFVDKALRHLAPFVAHTPPLSGTHPRSSSFGFPSLSVLCKKESCKDGDTEAEEEKHSYNVQRDIGNVLALFGIKRRREQPRLEGGQRASVYAVDIESLGRLLIDASSHLFKVASHARRNDFDRKFFALRIEDSHLAPSEEADLFGLADTSEASFSAWDLQEGLEIEESQKPVAYQVIWREMGGELSDLVRWRKAKGTLTPEEKGRIESLALRVDAVFSSLALD